MKKHSLFTGILCALLLFVTACSSGESSSSSNETASGSSTDEKVKVVFWDLFSGNDGTVMTEVVEEFNRTHPNIEVEKVTQEWGEYYTKLTTAVLGNKAPDLGISHATRLMQLREEGVIQPLDEEAAQIGIGWSDITDRAVKGTTIDGEHYAVPLDYHAFLLFYNKKILGDMGLLNDQGEPEFKDYQQFVSLLEEVKANGSDIKPLALRGQGTFPLRLWYSFYKQLGGGDIFDDEKAMATIDKQIGVKALTAVSDLYNKYEVVPKGIVKEDSEMFQSGKTAFMINGTWAVNDTYQVLGDDLGVMPFPKFFDKKAVYADSHSFILPTNPGRDEKTTEAAMTFVKWVVDNGSKWSKAGHLPTSNKVLQSDELKQQPFREQYGSQVEYMEFIPATKKVWFANSPDLIDVLDGIWMEKYSIEEGLTKVEETITQQLQK